MGTRGMDTTGRGERCDAVARESAGDELASEIEFHGLPLQGFGNVFPHSFQGHGSSLGLARRGVHKRRFLSSTSANNHHCCSCSQHACVLAMLILEMPYVLLLLLTALPLFPTTCHDAVCVCVFACSVRSLLRLPLLHTAATATTTGAT